MRFVSRSSLPVILALTGIAWVAAVGAGLRSVWSYENAPGQTGAAPPQLPAEGKPVADGPVLIVTAHPRCPCTRATLEELAEIMVRSRGGLRARVYFYRPAGAAERWAHTDLWRSAAAIPGVEALPDDGGRTARRFGAATSGQAALYGADGRLLFSGGLTDLRGHAGESAGARAVLALCSRPAAGVSGEANPLKTPVYGCSLLNPASQAQKEAPRWSRLQ